MLTPSDAKWQEEKLRKLMFYQKCNELRDSFAKNRKVSAAGNVYILIKRRVPNE
jgi:hypothetical protein